MADLMNLASREVAAKTVKYGSYTFTIAAPKKLTIDSQGPNKVLDVTCPAGKAWSVTMTVEIQETTA